MPKVTIKEATVVGDYTFFEGEAHLTNEHKKMLKSDEAMTLTPEEETDNAPKGSRRHGEQK